MVFHPYNLEMVYEIIPKDTLSEITDKHGELLVLIKK